MKRRYCSTWNSHSLTSAFLPGAKLSDLFGRGKLGVDKSGGMVVAGAGAWECVDVAVATTDVIARSRNWHCSSGNGAAAFWMSSEVVVILFQTAKGQCPAHRHG